MKCNVDAAVFEAQRCFGIGMYILNVSSSLDVTNRNRFDHFLVFSTYILASTFLQ